MAQCIQKVCCICGKDVSSVKRTKDTAGNYFCQPCRVAQVVAAQDASPTSGDFAFTDCRDVFATDQVYDVKGQFFCKTCWASGNEVIAQADLHSGLPTSSNSGRPQ